MRARQYLCQDSWYSFWLGGGLGLLDAQPHRPPSEARKDVEMAYAELLSLLVLGLLAVGCWPGRRDASCDVGAVAGGRGKSTPRWQSIGATPIRRYRHAADEQQSRAGRGPQSLRFSSAPFQPTATAPSCVS